MSGDQILVYYTEHGTMTFSRGLIEHGGCNAEIGSHAARDLGIDCEILAPDRLSLHTSSEIWDWKEYHRRYVELLIEHIALLIENGLAYLQKPYTLVRFFVFNALVNFGSVPHLT